MRGGNIRAAPCRVNTALPREYRTFPVLAPFAGCPQYAPVMAPKLPFSSGTSGRSNTHVGSLREDRAAGPVARAVSARKNGALDEADQILRSLLEDTPADPNPAVDECLRLGMAYIETGQPAKALSVFQRAVAVRPDYGPAQAGQGYALILLKRFDEALPCLNNAVAGERSPIEWRFWRGFANEALGSDDNALSDYRDVLREKPDHAQALASRVLIALRRADWTEYADDVRRLEDLLEPRDGQAELADIRPFTSLLLPLSRAMKRRVAERRAQAFHSVPAVIRSKRSHDRIRVGYFSDHFRKHPTARLMAGLFQNHDRARFEIFVYSTGRDEGGSWRPRIVEGAEHFVDLQGLDDRRIAERMAADGIDILLDLMVYIRDSRPGVLARRPAPIQVSYLGYPGTSGAPFIDYLVADAVTVPPEHEADYSEAIIRLPGSYQVNDTIPATSPQAKKDWGLPEDRVVFNCFNNSYKLEPDSFAAWMEILRNVEGSILWLIDSGEVANTNLRRAASSTGIDPERLIFAPRCDFETHLARQGLADLALDTFVYGAHTTASDALSMGVPLLTKIGPCFPSRVSAGLLTALGLTELIATTRETFVGSAIEIGNDPARLRSLRAKLRTAIERSSVFRPDTFAANLESAFNEILARHRKGLSPTTFNI